MSDLLPKKKAQLARSYHFAREFRGQVTLGHAVQEGNYRENRLADLWAFAGNLGLSYLFWYPEEPYFTRDVVPFLSEGRHFS